MNSTPQNSSRELLTVSAEFKKEAAKAIAAIIAFLLVYLLLFALSIGLIALSVYAGISIIALRPSFYTLLIGGGLIAFGIMIFIFLVKFLFATAKQDQSDSIEIRYEDQPRLFDTVYELARETGTSRPKKIFLSADVNACVFYNSSFWSMFLPVKKNLKIGLGLVNALNVGELKAVVAHEFGHFSQRSMKVGSWVYQVNKVIYDMLYNNHGYAEAIRGIASIHGILAFFAQITVKVVQAIQWILQQMFKVVNKAYLSLSRQMEFHADLVAASVCGSNNIVSSLKRVEFADACFHSTIGLCNTAWKEKKIIDDVYTDHTLVMKRIAEMNHLSFHNGLPVVKEEEETAVSRINYKNQWASHPTLQERKEHLDQYNLTADEDNSPAWSLFTGQEQLKFGLTTKIYSTIPKEEVQAVLSANEFEALVDEQFKLFAYPEIFEDYYDSRQIDIFDPNEMIQEAFVMKSFDEMLTKETMQLPKKIVLLRQDIAVLNAILKKEIVVSSFDFDGQKYSSRETAQVLAQLEGELDQKQKELVAIDKNLFRYFYAIAPLPEAEALKQKYVEYFNQRRESDHFLNKVNEMMEAIAPLYQGNLTIETVRRIVGDLKQIHDPVFKKLLQQWLDKNILSEQSVFKARVEKFIASHYEYFSGTSFFNNELSELNTLAQEMWTATTQYLFLQFKTIAEIQANLVTKKEKQLVN